MRHWEMNFGKGTGRFWKKPEFFFDDDRILPEQ
jgi:hypothetical protein